jgi:hypothetical protein
VNLLTRGECWLNYTGSVYNVYTTVPHTQHPKALHVSPVTTIQVTGIVGILTLSTIRQPRAMHCLLMVTGRCFGWQRLNYAQCIAGTPPSACVMKEKNAIDCFSRCTVLSVPCCLTVSALRQTWERGSAYLGDSVSHSPTPAPADAKTKPPASLTVMERRSAEIPTAWVGGKRVCSRQARSGATGCLTPGSAQKSSCAWARRAGSAQGTGPGGLPGSTATFWRFSHQPDALNCHPQRGKPGQAGREGRARRAKGRRQ